MKSNQNPVRKKLAWLLALTLLLAVLPISAVAEENFALKPLAEMTCETGTPTEFIAGNQLFTDRVGVHLVGESIPAYLEGCSYLLDYIFTTKTATATSNGWVYMITQSFAGEVETLMDQGFTVQTTIASNGISPTLANEMTVMGKYMETGDSVTWGASSPEEVWSVLIAAFPQETITLEPLAKVKLNGDSVGTFQIAGRAADMFSDRVANFAFGAAIPDYLVGQSYLMAPFETGVDVTVEEAGWVYVLTPYGGGNSQLSVLTDYEQIAVFDPGTVVPWTGAQIHLVGKEVAAGETVEFGKWGILFATGTDVGPEYITDVVKLNPTDEQYQDGNRQWQGIPSMAKAANGRLWATWYSGGPSEGVGNWTVLYTSADDGETWTGPVVAVDAPGDVLRVFDTNLWMDPDGRLWYFWNQDDSSYPAVWAMHTSNPGDANPTWSSPERIANGISLCDPIVLSTGEWLLPSAIWQGYSNENTAKWLGEEYGSTCYISTDKGDTWSFQGSVTEFEGQRNCDENMIVEQEDGSLRMLIRMTGTGIEESYSYDKGKTWTAAKDIGLTNTTSRFYISRLASGNQILVYHDVAEELGSRRINLTIALSEDDGKTWPYKLLLDDRFECSYPDAQQDADGNIYIIHDIDRWSSMEILMSKVTEEDIKAGKLVSDSSYIRKLVNDNKLGTPQPYYDYDAGGQFDMEALAEVEPLEDAGTMGIICVGAPIFTSTSECFAASMPDSLEGNAYLYGHKFNHRSVKVTTDGYLYILVCVDGNTPEVQMIRDQGFKHVVTLIHGQLGIGGWPYAVMEKQVSAGDVITLGKEAVLVAHADSVKNLSEKNNLAHVAPDAGYSGTFNTMEVGAPLFSNRDTHIITDAMPNTLKDVSYFYAPLENGLAATVRQDGWVYVLTVSCVEELMGQGFEVIETYPERTLVTTIAGAIRLMGKEMKAGDKFSYGEWGVLLAEKAIVVTGITLNQTELKLNVGDTRQLVATIAPADAVDQAVTWSSSDEAVATVENGLITAIGGGEAVITVTTTDGGFTATCTVTVHEHSYKDTVVPPTCTENGYTEHKCDCGDSYKDTVVPTEGHKWGAWVETKAPQVGVEGEERRDCDNCDEFETRPVDALKEDPKPEDPKPEDPKPEDPKPEDPKPEDPKPEDPKPEDPKPENPFVDIKEDMFCYDAVLWAYANNITTGKDATHFNPSGNCTRAQVVTFLWRAAGEPEPASAENPFPDVAEGKYYTKAVLWAVEKGITAGYKDGTFGPNKTCTRDQIVTFLWRYAGKPEAKETDKTFPDVKDGSFYAEAVLWAVEEGITTGYKDGTFGPSKTCKRDQIVTFLYRYIVD